jgi:hypothetical protein
MTFQNCWRVQSPPCELRTVATVQSAIFVIANVASGAILDEDKLALLEQMDKHALSAREELERQLDDWQAKDVPLWWKRCMKAGHKRLGRILFAFSKKVKPEPR